MLNNSLSVTKLVNGRPDSKVHVPFHSISLPCIRQALNCLLNNEKDIRGSLKQCQQSFFGKDRSWHYHSQ